MKDISQFFKGNDQDEVIWDELRYKVILFRNDSPIAFAHLSDNENTMDKAMEKAMILLQGGGIKMMGA